MKTGSMFVAWSLALAAGVTLGGCHYLAVQTAPASQPASSRTEASVKADELFWQTFHTGQYQEIPGALQALTGA